MKAYLGIDVGTGSARAGIFNEAGQLLGSGQHPIKMWRPRPDYVQQSSADIWAAIMDATHQALDIAPVTPADICGIGFDATCSLVVAGADGVPVSIDPDGAPDQDIIVWMDHRALSDSEDINAIGGEPLRHVGGRISPEMQLPKLRWLKNNAPDQFAAAEHFWDLPDWLVHRATGSYTRSLCSAVCKWTYLGHKGLSGEGWDEGFLGDVGLADLAQDGHAKIGNSFSIPGDYIGGLTALAAKDLGLAEGTPVATSLIDAHAGALGTLGANGGDVAGRLAIIAGTSNCHIGLTEGPVFVPGVWGPYFGAVLPGFWANEGGQTAAGAMIDAVLSRHAATADMATPETSLHQALEDRLAALGLEPSLLTARRHVLPDFHGNRSPLAEPWRLGGIMGLSLDTGADDAALDYLAAVQAVCYGTRHIVDAMREAGQPVHELVVSGGLSQSGLFVRELADICQLPVLVPETKEPVLLGSAILGAVAAQDYDTPLSALRALSPKAETIEPRGGDIAAFHQRKYAVYRRMQDDYAAIENIMEGSEA